MISCVLFLNQKGDVVIGRSYRDDVDNRLAEEFKSNILSSEETLPVMHLDTASFVHMRHGKLILVAVTRANANAFLILKYLHNLIEVLESYFGVVDEESIRNNFVLIYELLDEMMDFGYPQNTDSDILKLVITQKGIHSEHKGRDISVAATGVVNWRAEGLKYRKNELYIDVNEDVNLLMSAKGTILRSDVAGKVTLTCRLSGMPECKFGLNDKIMLDKQPAGRSGAQRKGNNSSIVLDDVTFDKCVRLGKFDSDRTISFVPPDGEFELMKYRVTENTILPFKIIPNVREIGRTRLEVTVKVKANYEAKQTANVVRVIIPVPKTTSKCRFQKAAGKAKYSPEQNAVVWRLRSFQGQSEFSLTTEVEMTATVGEKAWVRPPISMQFQVPMFTASQLKVMFLKVTEKSGYQTVKWVRYITRAGQYECRM